MVWQNYRKAILLFVFLSAKLYPETQEKLLKSLEKENYDEVEKILLDKPNLIKEQWEQIEKLVYEKNPPKLRRLYLQFWQKIKVEPKDNEEKLKLSQILHEELVYIRKKDYQANEDLAMIRHSLDLIGKFELKENFYDVLVFIVYPLSDIRRDAFRVLAVFKDDRMYPALMKLISSENPLERTYALDALYYIRDERTTPLLLQALKDPNKSVRYYAIRTLENMEKNDAIPYFIRIVQEDLDYEVRIKSIQALAKLNARSAFSVIARAISDENVEVRKEALRAILTFKDPSASYYISEQLAREKDTILAEEQIKALLELKNSGGMNGLNRIISKENDQHLRLWGIFAAGFLADVRGYEAVLSNIVHESAEIRAEAAFALGSIGNKNTVPLLVTLVKYDPDYGVQSAALQSLYKINSEESFPDLFDIGEEHNDLRIRFQSKEILRKLLYKKYRK